MKTYHLGKVILPSAHGSRITKVPKTRLFSIDLIKINTLIIVSKLTSRHQEMPHFHENTRKRTKKHKKMRLKNHRTRPISCPPAIVFAYFHDPFLQ
ncbi:hypothetical protein [Herbaspirillum seropedicae]|uniref:hypothetical protein n=1 Tax=Herbaspirillum seropedicae TaxID=964 RepID=UPI003FCD4ECD